MSIDTVTEIKKRLSIEDYVQKYVQLKRNGTKWLGLCPFHQEKTPSFTVNPASGFYYCFGCHAYGDIFSFAEKYHGISFREALTTLAQNAGVEILYTGGRASSNKKDEASQKHRLYSMYSLVSAHFAKNLRGVRGTSAMEYFKSRGITQESIELFSLGYSLPLWDDVTNLLQKNGYTKEELALSGLVQVKEKSTYDAFRGRYMFPIFSMGGAVIAFGGRIAKEEEEKKELGKYINSTETPIYTKSKNLYGIMQARKNISATKRVLITEGYLDVISMHQYGYNNSVAVLGTALTKEHASVLSSLAPCVELIFDGDNAGTKATLVATRLLLMEGVKVYVTSLPEGEDIDSFLRKYGTQAFESLREKAVTGIDFCIDTMRNASPKEQSEWIRSFINEIKDPLLLSHYAERFSFGFGLSQESILKANAVVNKKNVMAINIEENALDEGNQESLGNNIPISEKERTLIRHLISYPEHIGEIRRAGMDFVLHSKEAKEIVEAFYENNIQDITAICLKISGSASNLLANIMVEIDPSEEKGKEEFMDIIQYLQKEYTLRNMAGLKALITSYDDIDTLATIQKIIQESMASSPTASALKSTVETPPVTTVVKDMNSSANTCSKRALGIEKPIFSKE